MMFFTQKPPSTNHFSEAGKRATCIFSSSPAAAPVAHVTMVWAGTQEVKLWGEFGFRCLLLYILKDSQPNGEIQHSSGL